MGYCKPCDSPLRPFNCTFCILITFTSPRRPVLYPPLCAPRSDALDKFAVLNIQVQHLSAQLRPLLQHYSAYPRSVNQTNAPILPIMLATKLLPEQEAEQEELLASGDAPEGVKDCARAVAELAALVAALTQNGGPLDPKGPLRTQLTAAVKAASESRRPATTTTAPAAPPPRAPAPPAPLEGGDLLLAAACYGEGLTA